MIMLGSANRAEAHGWGWGVGAGIAAALILGGIYPTIITVTTTATVIPIIKAMVITDPSTGPIMPVTAGPVGTIAQLPLRPRPSAPFIRAMVTASL